MSTNDTTAAALVGEEPVGPAAKRRKPRTNKGWAFLKDVKVPPGLERPDGKLPPAPAGGHDTPAPIIVDKMPEGDLPPAPINGYGTPATTLVVATPTLVPDPLTENPDGQDQSSETAGSPRRRKPTARATPTDPGPQPTEMEPTGKTSGQPRRRSGGAAKSVKPEVISQEEMELIEQIRESCERFKGLVRTTVEQAAEIGRRIQRLKDLVGHGRYLKCLKCLPKNFRISESSARIYMRLARAWDGWPDGDPNQQALADLGIERAMKSLARPQPKDGETRASRKPRKAKSGDSLADSEPAAGEDDPGQSAAEAQGGHGQHDAHPTDDPDRAETEPGDDGTASAAEREDDPSRADRNAQDNGDRQTNPATDNRDRPDTEPGAEATAGATDPEAVEQADGAAGDGSDEAWLAPLAVRSQLANTAIFDKDALLWRRLQHVVADLHRRHQPSGGDLKSAWNSVEYRKRYSYLVAAFAGVDSPDRWEVCETCNGLGRGNDTSKPCYICNGGGFAITHAGQRVRC
jgi:hypothetical protein